MKQIWLQILLTNQFSLPRYGPGRHMENGCYGTEQEDYWIVRNCSYDLKKRLENKSKKRVIC